MLGTTQDYFVKGDRYFTKMNGTLIDWQSYSAKENKYYFKLTNNNKVYWKNASENKSPDTLIAHNKNVIMILGHSCDELVYKNTNRIHKYYFSTDFPMDSKLYANHHYGNWYLYLSVAQALPLKEIYISPEFTMESEATAVTEEIIDPKVFVIPAGLFLEESRY
ncbi:MAG: hypothetical protein JWQ25_1653 [Daejeonella sp.]|nr:hypothetical protein [Daejeonella sp.]